MLSGLNPTMRTNANLIPQGIVSSAQAPYSPLNHPELSRWYDDAEGVRDNAGIVYQQDDNSLLLGHATQSAESERPLTGIEIINGLNAMTPDGVDDNLDTGYHPDGAAKTIILTHEYHSDVTTRLMLGCNDGNSRRMYIGTIGTKYIFGVGNGYEDPEVSFSIGSINTVVLRLDGSEWKGYVNGQLLFTKSYIFVGTSTTPLKKYGFSSAKYKAPVMASVIVEKYMTDAEINQEAGRQAARWGSVWADL